MIRTLFRITLAIFILSHLLLVGCKSSLPFSYEYKSEFEVEILYKGKAYLINSLAKDTDTPFEYEFERDGDLDITVEGKTYELESPYDISRKKSTKKK